MKTLHFKGHTYKDGDWLFDTISGRHFTADNDDLLYAFDNVEIYGIISDTQLGDSYELVDYCSRDTILKVEDYNPTWYAIYDDNYDWGSGSYDIDRAKAAAEYNECAKIVCVDNSSCNALKIGEYNLIDSEWVYSR